MLVMESGNVGFENWKCWFWKLEMFVLESGNVVLEIGNIDFRS